MCSWWFFRLAPVLASLNFALLIGLIKCSILISGAFTYNSATCLSARFRRKQIIIFESRRGFCRNNIRSLFFSAAPLHKLYVATFYNYENCGWRCGCRKFLFLCMFSFCYNQTTRCGWWLVLKVQTKEYLQDLKRTFQFSQLFTARISVCVQIDYWLLKRFSCNSRNPHDSFFLAPP